MSLQSPPADLTAHDSLVAEPVPQTTTASGLNENEEPYSVFSKSEKWVIVSLTALAGLFRSTSCSTTMIVLRLDAVHFSAAL